jgi:hypothetical protein
LIGKERGALGAPLLVKENPWPLGEGWETLHMEIVKLSIRKGRCKGIVSSRQDIIATNHLGSRFFRHDSDKFS